MPTLRLLKFDAQEYATQTKSRAGEIERAYIDGCPEQLWIYRLAASRYWWVRYYLDRKVYRKSTKQIGKREAVSFAKSYYDNIITQGTVLDPQSTVTNFRVLGESVVVTEQAKLKRGELTKMTYDNFVYRYQKSVPPYFGEMDV